MTENERAPKQLGARLRFIYKKGGELRAVTPRSEFIITAAACRPTPEGQ